MMTRKTIFLFSIFAYGIGGIVLHGVSYEAFDSAASRIITTGVALAMHWYANQGEQS